MTPQAVTYQVLLSMEFSRQEYWSGWPFFSSGDLPDPEIDPRSPALQVDSLLAEPPGKSFLCYKLPNLNRLKQQILSHTTFEGQETRSILAGWFWVIRLWSRCWLGLQSHAGLIVPEPLRGSVFLTCQLASPRASDPRDKDQAATLLIAVSEVTHFPFCHILFFRSR